LDYSLKCEILTKGDERCDRKQTLATFGVVLEEWELTLNKLGNTLAKANQVSGLTIGWAKNCMSYDDV